MIRQTKRSRERHRLGHYTRLDFELDNPHTPAPAVGRKFREQERPAPPMLRDRLRATPSPEGP